MGRGRQKAKATRQAREMKYFSPQTDLTALQRELRGSEQMPPLREPVQETVDQAAGTVSSTAATLSDPLPDPVDQVVDTTTDTVSAVSASDVADVTYKCSTYYDGAIERGPKQRQQQQCGQRFAGQARGRVAGRNDDRELHEGAR